MDLSYFKEIFCQNSRMLRERDTYKLNVYEILLEINWVSDLKLSAKRVSRITPSLNYIDLNHNIQYTYKQESQKK